MKDTCVVFPQPVSPQTTSASFSLSRSNIRSFNSAIGREALPFSISYEKRSNDYSDTRCRLEDRIYKKHHKIFMTQKYSHAFKLCYILAVSTNEQAKYLRMVERQKGNQRDEVHEKKKLYPLDNPQ